MINRAFEWYRIVDVSPSGQTIDNRKLAIHDAIKLIDDSKDWNLALACAVGVVMGFDTFSKDSPHVQSLVGAIRAHDSAFPQDLSENALALRAFSAIALGEILVRHGAKSPATDAILIASVLRSGLGARPAPQGRHLSQMLVEVNETAAKTLTSAAIARRRRVDALSKQFETAQPTDLAGALKSLAALSSAMQEVSDQSVIDREELNVLWWMFAGASNSGKQISELPIGAAVVCCGVELSNQCLLPPTQSLEAIVRRAFETGRAAKETVAISVEKIATDWDDQSFQLILPDESTHELARLYPALLPLSWLCERLLASKGAAGWADEFERMTGIPANRAIAPAEWAIQAFRERVACRLYAKSLEG